MSPSIAACMCFLRQRCARGTAAIASIQLASLAAYFTCIDRSSQTLREMSRKNLRNFLVFVRNRCCVRIPQSASMTICKSFISRLVFIFQVVMKENSRRSLTSNVCSCLLVAKRIRDLLAHDAEKCGSLARHVGNATPSVAQVFGWE